MPAVELNNQGFKLKNPYGYRWLMFAVLGVLYFFVCLHRISPTVIARDLVLEFDAGATALGLMASAYFYLYAIVQPPVGVLSDLWGPRRLITSFTLMAGLGAFIFGFASNMTMATVGRAIIGVGVGGVFVPALKIFSIWYREREFASVTGMFLACGNLGNLSASLPLTYLILWLGWRSSLFAIGTTSLLLALLCWFVMQDKPEDKGWQPIGIETAPTFPTVENATQDLSVARRLGIVFKKPEFWMVTLSMFFFGGASLTFQGLWAVPYMMDVYQFSRVQAGGHLMFISIGFIVGAPTIGFLTDRMNLGRKSILLCTLGIGLGAWSVFFVSGGKPGSDYLIYLFLIMGISGGGSLSLYMTITKELFPQWLTGTAVGLMNTSAFISTAIFQPCTGFLMDAVGRSGTVYPLKAYYHNFSFFLICAVIAVIMVTPLSIQKNLAK